jgi:hypothetical protein
MKVTKELILELTEGGLRFFMYVFKDLEIMGDRSKNTLNPYYDDKKPGVSVYKKGDKWYYKDHGNPEFSGDMFSLAAYHFDKCQEEEFPEILEALYEIDYDKYVYGGDNFPPTKLSFELFRRENDSFKKSETEYFAQYGITKRILREYNVLPIDGYIATGKNGNDYTYRRKNGKMLFAYSSEWFSKIYSPNPKFFRYVGNKPKDYIFGFEQIEDEKFIFITGGEKDVLTLRGLGYGAVCFNSETAHLPKGFIEYLKDIETYPISLLDSDETGIKQAELLLQKHKIPRLIIPDEFIELGGKDISDYVKLGLSEDQFEECVDLAIQEHYRFQQLKEVEKAESIENIHETELFPLELFDQLPDFFKKCCNAVEEQQDKSLVLLSSLALAGGVFRNVVGFYDYYSAGTNLFLFVIAPASSGKGLMKYPKILGQQVHEYMKEKLLEATKEGERKLQVFFIPANSSSSSILAQLANNSGYGMLWETEADTLNETLSKDWGNFSDALRKTFHHEHISYQRKTNNEFVEIPYPSMGVVLSGTPNQVNGLISSAENGLFSRMMFMDFKGKSKWNRNLHLSQKKLDLTKYFSLLGEDVFEFFKRLEDLEYNINFSFTEEQWRIFHDYFEEWHENARNLFGDGIMASIKRLGLMTFKIGMILTASRLMKEDELPEEISCSDVDFETAIKIASCCKSHMISVYSRLITKDKTARLSNLEQSSYYESLSDEFTKAESRKIADSIGLKHKTAENHIDLYIEKKMLVRYAHGKYRKIK